MNSPVKFKAPPKRKKLDEPPASSYSCKPAVSPLEKRDVVMELINYGINCSSAPETKASGATSVDMIRAGTNSVVAQPGNVSVDAARIQQARTLAVAQAQEDGCKGNYKVFDSPFGNYLVPVIPNVADLDK